MDDPAGSLFPTQIFSLLQEAGKVATGLLNNTLERVL
jgi:hypothetical protein